MWLEVVRTECIMRGVFGTAKWLYGKAPLRLIILVEDSGHTPNPVTRTVTGSSVFWVGGCR